MITQLNHINQSENSMSTAGKKSNLDKKNRDSIITNNCKIKINVKDAKGAYGSTIRKCPHSKKDGTLIYINNPGMS